MSCASLAAERRIALTYSERKCVDLVKNKFMAGECYALSFDLVEYIGASPALKTLTRGKEDKLVAKWIGMHPQREEIVWSTDRCWIYDHPKAGTV